MASSNVYNYFDVSDHDSFLQHFEFFCYTSLPGNPKLRNELIRKIQYCPSSSETLKPATWYSLENLLPPLPNEWERYISTALDRPKISNKIFSFHVQSLQRLRPGEMVDDEIINAYLTLIRRPDAIVSTTMLLDPLKPNSPKDPIDRGINYETLITRGQILIPIYISELRHWSFVRMVPRMNENAQSYIELEYYDSLGLVEAPQKFIKWYSSCFENIPTQWKPASSPQQAPGSMDCALFVLMGIRLLSSGSHHLSQLHADEHIPKFRNRVAAELLASRLDPSLADLEKYKAENDTNQLQQTNIEVNRGCVGGSGMSYSSPFVLSTPEPHHSPSRLNLSVRRSKSLNLAKSCVDSFGNEHWMLDVLKGAVMGHRAEKACAEESGENLYKLWVQFESSDENPQQILKSRHGRALYSQKFYQEVQKHNGNPHHIDGRAKDELQRIFGCGNDIKTWKAVHNMASTASVWTSLLLFFQRYGIESPVALCAASGNTAQWEALDTAARAAILSGLKDRVEDSKDCLLRNLHAASALSLAVVQDKLPDHKIAIEMWRDLKLMEFGTVVSLDAKLRLPL